MDRWLRFVSYRGTAACSSVRQNRLRSASGTGTVVRAVGVTQTIPSIALLAFMIPLFRVGALPALAALWVYSLFPILRNTYTGVREADPAAVEAADDVQARGFARARRPEDHDQLALLRLAPIHDTQLNAEALAQGAPGTDGACLCRAEPAQEKSQ